MDASVTENQKGAAATTMFEAAGILVYRGSRVRVHSLAFDGKNTH